MQPSIVHTEGWFSCANSPMNLRKHILCFPSNPQIKPWEQAEF
uniref:Uncharacterized protein n=1 Tax=Zea mays TaxID=4577 RepID=C4J0Q4_MAIZE|nr:unknown [Zea mays]